MKRLLIGLLLAVLGLAPYAVATAGSCAVSDVTSTQIAATSNRIADSGTVIVTLVCVGSSSDGSFPAITIPLTGFYPTNALNTYNLTGYRLYEVGRTPGTTQPTNNYTVTIKDVQGFALDAGLLTTNGSSTAAQLTPIVLTTSTVVTGYPVVRSALTVAITVNTVHSANITLDLIFRAEGW